MKKEKSKDIEKSKKKAIRGSIAESLTEKINESIAHLGYQPKKFAEEVEKASNQLAKKITQNIKIKKQELLEIIKSKNQLQKPKEEAEESGNVSSYQSGTDEDQQPSQSFNTPIPKRVVKGSTRNMNVDPIALAEKYAQEKINAGEPDLDEQLGSVS